jgi:predicted  nucleic acid-binding Zn-ribbon protein
MLGRVAASLDKLKTIQETINEVLKAIDELENKQVSDANKDTVGASLDHERESLSLKLRWANDEREVTMKDLNEAIRLAKVKEDEIREQEKRIKELRKEIDDLRKLIEERKKTIAALEREIQILNEKIEIIRQKIADLDDTIAELRSILNEREDRLRELTDLLGEPPIPVEINYKAVKGDVLDEMLAQYLLNCPVPVKRLGGGFYLFGTRKIYAKIMNGKLVVRVGGGYMFISEFITTYSDPEISKLTKICENLGIESIWDLDIEELYNSKSGGGSPLNAASGLNSPGRGGKEGSFKKSLKGSTGSSPLNGSNRQKAFNASALVRKL